jgi:hypothetical protein
MPRVNAYKFYMGNGVKKKTKNICLTYKSNERSPTRTPRFTKRSVLAQTLSLSYLEIAPTKPQQNLNHETNETNHEETNLESYGR